MDVYQRLRDLELELPPVGPPSGVFVPGRPFGEKLVYFSGMGPEQRDGEFIYRGKLGRELDIETGMAVARSVGVTMLAQMHACLGDLNRVRRIVKVLGFVNGTPDFAQQPAVMNGFSNLMIEVFGEEVGVHARSAIGAGSLPANIPVEVEMLVELV